MLKDVLFITQKVFNEALIKEENLINPKKIYDVYRSLEEVISDLKLVANHYLALTFREPYLQNSSWGEPIDKWRKFLNMDFEELNKSVKKYLHLLSHLTHDDFMGWDTYVHKIYSPKTYYSFVRDNYNIGFVEPRGAFLHITCLKTDLKNVDTAYISQYKKINLSTFEARVSLKNELNEINNNLEIEFDKLKSYIQNRFILDDLL
ncbi:hypothetical protein ACOL23_00710 [Aliarcobacter butzleri]|uniref:hypothetical protein n=1 Tax=Aliarcobacter butzleri TaxID=28197 RepID=UPI0021B308C0|nr:hypothetical protein [Aliarcobacter butzleri]MCT7572803.1 hypothetical protein [Aliarcobacter butzleri]